jgi:predicted nucleic acid-binding Zn ribbon protein
MSETGAAPSKVCVVCGMNVADKPRVKDAAGRYMCKPCAEKQTAARPSTGAVGKPGGGASPRPSPKPASGPIPLAGEGGGSGGAAGGGGGGGGGFDPVMAALVASSEQANSANCPNCKGWVKPGQRICTSCGFNLEEGKQVRTRIQREKAPKESRSGGSGKSRWHVGERGESAPMVVGIGMFLLNAAALGVASADPQKYLALTLFNSICGLVLFVAVLIQAYQSGLGMFLMLLLSQCIPIVGVVVYIYFLLTKCESATVKWAGLGAIFGSIVGVVILFANDPDFLDEMRSRRRGGAEVESVIGASWPRPHAAAEGLALVELGRA